MAGAAVARGRTPPCIEFNRRDAKVSLSIPGRRKRRNEREVGVEDKETGKDMSPWCPMCSLLWATSLVGSVVACVCSCTLASSLMWNCSVWAYIKMEKKWKLYEDSVCSPQSLTIWQFFYQWTMNNKNFSAKF